MESKYLFIITLLFFIQPDWAELECENVLEYKGRVGCCENCGCKIIEGANGSFGDTGKFYTKQNSTRELQVMYSILVLLIVLRYLQS